jgi:hypothetical protein
MKSDFLLAFNEIAEVRKLPRETIIEALRAALVSAYRRNAGIGSGQHVEARIDDHAGTLTIWVEKEVVDDVASESTEVTLENARIVEPQANLPPRILDGSPRRPPSRSSCSGCAKQSVKPSTRSTWKESGTW